MKSSRPVSALFLLAALLMATPCGAADSATVTVSKIGPWLRAETANFYICAIAPEAEVRSLAAACERTREQLVRQWLGDKAGAVAWSPKCYVVLHPTAESYLREVGEGQQTAGSSLIELENKKIVTRRVDLRADHPEGCDDALAHEMTHVVVADGFMERQIPRWADEGMAVLADSTTKQTLHFADLRQARDERGDFRVAELLGLENYPPPEQQGAFYGQSASLTKFLVDKGTPAQFMRFVQRANAQGYDVALRDIYNIPSVIALEQQWARHVDSSAGNFASNDIVEPRTGVALLLPKKIKARAIGFETVLD
jgi:hypothetical protein